MVFLILVCASIESLTFLLLSMSTAFNEMIVDSGSVFESFSGKEIAVHAASQKS